MMIRQTVFNGYSIADLKTISCAMAAEICAGAGLRNTHFMPRDLLPYFQSDDFSNGFNRKNAALCERKIQLYKLTAGCCTLVPLFQDFSRISNSCLPVIWGQTLTAVIGKGSSSVTYLTSSGHALKVSDHLHRDRLEKEYKLLGELRNPNLVQTFDFFESSSGAAILEEKLFPDIGNMEEYSTGLNFLHHHSICHGDVRRSNLGCSAKGIAKWLDLGNAFAGNIVQQNDENKTLKILFTHFSGAL